MPWLTIRGSCVRVTGMIVGSSFLYDANNSAANKLVAIPDYRLLRSLTVVVLGLPCDADLGMGRTTVEKLWG